MGKGFDIPWVGGSTYHGYGVKIQWMGLFNIPWVGVKIPCVRGSIYHG